MREIAIEDFIPQRPPFTFIERVIDVSDDDATTSFEITAACVLLENDQLTAAGIIENVAQSAALYAGHFYQKKGITPPIGYIASVKNLEIFMNPKVGEVIYTTVELVNEVMDFRIFQGTVKTTEGEDVAHCELRIMTKPE